MRYLAVCLNINMGVIILNYKEKGMKEVVRELVKFNLKAVLLFFVLGLTIYFLDIRGPNTEIALLLLFTCIWYIFSNLKILYRSRRTIIDYFKTGSVEIAAGVIEFKEHASTRARERIEEKKKKDDNQPGYDS